MNNSEYDSWLDDEWFDRIRNSPEGNVMTKAVNGRAEDMVERVAEAIMNAMGKRSADAFWHPEMCRILARAAIEAMRELPGDPGPRYNEGEYSRRSQAAMVDDALQRGEK